MSVARAVLILAALIGLLALVAWMTLHSPEDPVRRGESKTEEVDEPDPGPLGPIPDPESPQDRPPADAGAAAPSARGVIVGAVTGPGGAPAKGAEVYAALTDQVAVLRSDLAAWGRVGEDGKFLLVAPLEETDVLAWMPGTLPAIVRGVQVAPGAVADVGTLALAPGLAATGQVVDTAGDPVANAEVVAFRDETLTSRALLPARFGLATWGGRGETDERGDFRVGGLTPEPVTVTAWALGYRMEGEPVEAVPGGPAVRLVLKRLRIATGKVVVETGGIGIPGATVKLNIRGPRGGFARKGVTFESGRFSFDLSADEYASDALRYDVLVSADGYEDAALRDLTIEELLPDARLRIPLVKAPPTQPGKLTGRALYDTGEPFVGRFTLSFSVEGKAGQIFRVSTDETGAFVLEGVPAGEYVLRTAARRSLVLRETGRRLVIPPGGEETTELVFTRGGDVEVRITDFRGTAPKGAFVRVLDDEGTPGDPVLARNGVAVVHDLPPGTVRLRVGAPGHRDEEVSVTVTKGVRSPAPVRLEEAR